MVWAPYMGDGPQGMQYGEWETIPAFSAKVFSSNKIRISTFAAIEELGPEVGADMGADPNISGMWKEHAVLDSQYTDLGHYQGPNAPFIYTGNTTTATPFHVRWSFARTGWDNDFIQTRMIEMSGQKRFRNQENDALEKMKGFLLRHEYEMLGVNTFGQGGFDDVGNSPEPVGIIPALRNTNPYYDLPRFANGHINSVNRTGDIVAAGELYNYIDLLMDLVEENDEPPPFMWLTNRRCKRTWKSEMINVYTGGTGTHNVIANQTLDGPFMRYQGIDYMNYDDKLLVIFDSNIPGDGTGAANNTLIGLQLQYYEKKWVQAFYFNEPLHAPGGADDLFSNYYNVFAWWHQVLHVPPAWVLSEMLTYPGV